MMNRVLRTLRAGVRFLTQTKQQRRHGLVGPTDIWEMKRDFQIQFLKGEHLRPEHYLLDIGCGTLRGGIPLIEYLEEGHYFGFEVRAKALDEGRKELKEAGLEGKRPTLLLSQDISEVRIDQKFDFVWAFSVLIHMTDEILNKTLAFVSDHLTETGVFYANLNISEGKKEGQWREFPIVRRTFDFYRQACAANNLVTSDLGALKDLGHLSNLEGGDNQRMLRISKRHS